MSVYKAITAVSAALSKEGISKDKKNVQQGYSFRGIDDVYNALAPLLASNALCILPRVLSRECVERVSAKGSALFYVTVHVEFDLVSADDGSKHTVAMYGEAMDSGDKATNKAMSAAYKYMAMEVFAIPTEGDNDADATTHEVKPKSVAKEAFDSLPHDQQNKIADLATKAKDLLAAGNVSGAFDAYEDAKGQMDTEIHQAALWSLFGSAERSAIKAEGVKRK